jgi:hypothetical protein
MPLPRLYGRAQERFGHRRSTFGAPTLSDSYADTRTVLSGNDESTIEPPQSPWRGLENFLLGASQSIEHATWSDDEESVDETHDGVNFFKPYPLDVSNSAESVGAYTYESYSIEGPNQPSATGNHKRVASDPVQGASRVYAAPGGVFGFSAPQTKTITAADWQRHRSETPLSLPPISPTGNPVVLRHPPCFREEAKLKEAKLKKAIKKTPNPKQVQPPLYNLSTNQEEEHLQQKTADPSSPCGTILPIWSLEEQEIIFEDMETALCDDPNLWSNPTESRNSKDTKLKQELCGNLCYSGKEDADSLGREADAKQSDSGKSVNSAKRRGLLSRMKPKAAVKVYRKFQETSDKYLRNEPDKSTPAIDTRQCEEDAREMDIVDRPSLASDPLRRAIVSPRETADAPQRQRMSPPWRQRVSPPPTLTMSVETQDRQAPSPKREDLDSPRKNLLRTRIPRFPTSPVSPLSDKGASNVRIVAPGVEDTEDIEVAERSPRMLARAFKTSKVSPDDPTPKTRLGLPSVATSTSTDDDVDDSIELTIESLEFEVDDSIELTAENWQQSVSKWFDFPPTLPSIGENAEDDDSEGQETQMDSIGPEGSLPAYLPKSAVKSDKAALTLAAVATSVDKISPSKPDENLPEYLPKSAVKYDKAVMTLAAVATSVDIISPSKPDEHLFPKMNRMAKKNEQKVPKTFQAPTSPKVPTMKVRTASKKTPVTSTGATNSLPAEKKVSELSETSKERQVHSPFGLMGLKSKKKGSKSKPPLKGLGVSSVKPRNNASPPDSSKVESRTSAEKPRKNGLSPDSSKVERRVSSAKPRKKASPPDSSKVENRISSVKPRKNAPDSSKVERRVSSAKPRKNASPPDSSKVESKIPLRKYHSEPLQKPSELGCKIKAGDHQLSKVERIPSKLESDLQANQESAIVPDNTAVSHLKRAVTPKVIPNRTPSKNSPVVLYPILDFNPCHAELLLGGDGSINLLADDGSIISRLENKDSEPRNILPADSANDPGLHKADSKAKAQADKIDFDHGNIKSISIEQSLEGIEVEKTASTTPRIRRIMNPFGKKIPFRRNNPVSTQAAVQAPFRALLRGDKRKSERKQRKSERKRALEATMNKAMQASLKTDGALVQTAADSALGQTEGYLDHQKAVDQMVVTATDAVTDIATCRVFFEHDLFESCLKPRYAELPGRPVRPVRLEEGGSTIPVELPQTKPTIRKGRFSGGSTEEFTDQVQKLVEVDQQQSSEAVSSGTCFAGGLAATLQALTLNANCAANASPTASQGGHSLHTAKASNKYKEHEEEEKHESASVKWSLPSASRFKKSLEKDRKERERLERVKERLSRRVNNDLTLLHSERSMEKDRKEGERLEGVKEKLARRLTADLKLLALVERKKTALFSSDSAAIDTGSTGRSSKKSDKSFNTTLILKAIDDLVTRRMDEEAKIRNEAAAKESYFGNVLGGMFACSAPVPDEEPKSTKEMFEA